jgi:D-alanyl-D-alanine carboxypeptidase
MIMNPRLAAMAALGREVAIPASVLALIAVSGFPAIDKTGAAPMVDRLAQSLAADTSTVDTGFADKLPPIASGTPDVVTASISVTTTPAADAAPAAVAPAPVVTAALTDPAETLPAETSSRESADASQAADCSAADTCIDRYLWALYQHTPKEDSVKIEQQRKVTVKKKGKLVNVTRTFTTLVDEDFSWKDPKAAENAVMPVADYVIGGMDRDFKVKLFHMLRAAEEAGLSPGITSAFRDDYRQWIASGLKAANDRSYHGGSSRGGYGHGLAADLVSVNGATRAQRLASSETLWNWIDAHGKDFGIGRPYLDRDPPHVGPIDGKEYADHHPGMRARQEGSAAKTRKRLASEDHRSTAKRARIARSRTI